MPSVPAPLGTEPKFSVIIPTFNRATLVLHAVESVLGENGDRDVLPAEWDRLPFAARARDGSHPEQRHVALFEDAQDFASDGTAGTDNGDMRGFHVDKGTGTGDDERAVTEPSAR